MKKRIQLATFNFQSAEAARQWLPYSVGCLISHCNKIPEIVEQYDFAEPWFMPKDPKYYKTKLIEADILGLTCYAWNQGYNDRLAEYYKKINPDGVVIYGGPQIPINKWERQEYFNARGFLDHCIDGPGEIAFAEWLLKKPRSNQRLRDLPTPYTDGLFDNIVKRWKNSKGSWNLGAPIESDRGCPYSCAFCDWGGNTRTKLTRFDQDTVMSQIDWIYSKSVIKEMFISNANLGILKRDIDIVKGIAKIQSKYNRAENFTLTYGGLAKNGGKHLQEVTDVIFNQISVYQHNMKVSFQTHTPEVLKIIKRDNIDNEKLIPLVKHWQEMGKKVSAEMIIALPGETADSWLKTLDYQTHYLDIQHAGTFILQITKNTLLDDPEYKEEHGIVTKRVTYGKQKYGLNIIRKCFSYDVEELVRMFDHHWVWNNFVNTGIVPKENLVSLYDQTKIFLNNIDQTPLMYQLLERNRSVVRKVFADCSHTHLDTLEESRWFSTTIRLNDLAIMEQNKHQAIDEISSVFKLPVDFKFEVVDSPIRKIPRVI